MEIHSSVKHGTHILSPWEEEGKVPCFKGLVKCKVLCKPEQMGPNPENWVSTKHGPRQKASQASAIWVTHMDRKLVRRETCQSSIGWLNLSQPNCQWTKKWASWSRCFFRKQAMFYLQGFSKCILHCCNSGHCPGRQRLVENCVAEDPLHVFSTWSNPLVKVLVKEIIVLKPACGEHRKHSGWHTKC